MLHDEPPNPSQSSEELAQSVTPLVRVSGPGRESIPDWAPWAVLSTLVAVGALGALGFIPAGKGQADSEAKSGAATSSVHAPVGANVPTPSASAARQYITASHIVVSYQGTLFASRYHVTRTRDEAKKLADQLLVRARNGEDFTKLVAEYSDDPQTKAQQGKVGRFTQKDALPAFSEVAFKLAPGDFGIAHTTFGYHVILRNE